MGTIKAVFDSVSQPWWRDGARLTVNLRIPSVPKRIESPCPRRNPSTRGQSDQYSEGDCKSGDDECSKEELELFSWDKDSDGFDKGNQLEETEDTYISLAMSVFALIALI